LETGLTSEELVEELGRWLEGAERLAVVGLGNELRADDAVGLAVVRALDEELRGLREAEKEKAGPATFEVVTLEGGMAAENVLADLTDPRASHVLFVDAADFGGRPGSFLLLDPSSIRSATISAHRIPVPVIAGLIERTTGAGCRALAIQVETVELGGEMSPEVARGARVAAGAVAKAVRRQGGESLSH